MHLMVGVVAFISEYLDSGLGMGYGTALTRIYKLLKESGARVIGMLLNKTSIKGRNYYHYSYYSHYSYHCAKEK